MRTSADDSWTIAEVTIAVVTGSLIAVGLGVYGLGALAGGLLGDGVPAVAVEELPAIAGRLPAHLDDPRGAWPARTQAVLPGAGGFLIGGVVLVAGVAGIAAGGLAISRLLSSHVARGARWSTGRQIRKLRV